MAANTFLELPASMMHGSYFPHNYDEIQANLEQDILHCSKQLELGQPVELPGCIKTRYGNELVGHYFSSQLRMSVNRPVQVTDDISSGNTLVQLAPMSEPHCALPTHLGTDASTPESGKQPIATTHHTIAIRKNPPRPMNCWMLFRDTKHRELKDANPEISVQKICEFMPR
jgi:hypothetical protein